MIDLPERQWIALRLPRNLHTDPPDGHDADLDAGQKHMMGAENPLNGRTYWTGGDFNGEGSTGSYRQFTFSLDLGERMADKANPLAGWRVVFPECANTLQPKHPDFTGWQWDETRRVFWMVPGILESSTTNCPGETADKVDNAAYLHSFVMTFDPATNTWAKSWSASGARGIPTTSWWSIYDPVKDLLLRAIAWNTTAFDMLDCKTGVWTAKILGKNAAGVDWIANHTYWATDYEKRQSYCRGQDGRLHRVTLDTFYTTTPYRADDLGPMPANDQSGEGKMVWDSINKVLIYHAYPLGWWAYDGKWVELPNVADNGISACGRAMCFSKADNCVMSWGLNSSDPAVTPSMPYLFLFRYAKPSGVTIQTAKAVSAVVIQGTQLRKPLK